MRIDTRFRDDDRQQRANNAPPFGFPSGVLFLPCRPRRTMRQLAKSTGHEKKVKKGVDSGCGMRQKGRPRRDKVDGTAERWLRRLQQAGFFDK